MADSDKTELDDMAADDRLKALFAEDAPPARDPRFSASVMERLMRRRFIGEVLRLSGVTALGGLILWALWPVVSPLIERTAQDLAPVAACLTLAAIAVGLAGMNTERSAQPRT